MRLCLDDTNIVKHEMLMKKFTTARHTILTEERSQRALDASPSCSRASWYKAPSVF